jgi:hypothetical protein
MNDLETTEPRRGGFIARAVRGLARTSGGCCDTATPATPLPSGPSAAAGAGSCCGDGGDAGDAGGCCG